LVCALVALAPDPKKVAATVKNIENATTGDVWRKIASELSWANVLVLIARIRAQEQTRDSASTIVFF
jgi:hypothetical protein